MELLEHPLEAVAFRLYYSLPEASAATGAAAWTCLAAVLAAAAAAGLWRLRSPAAPVGATKPLELKPATAAEGIRPDLFSSSERCDPAAAEAATTAPSPKERYMAYFRDTGCVGFCDVGDEEEEEYEADEEDGDGDADAEREDEDVRGGGGAYYRRTTPETTTGPCLGWETKVVVRTLPPVPPLSPTAAAAADARARHRRSRPTAALGGCVVRLWDHHQAAGGGGGGMKPTTVASPRRRGRAVGGTVVAAAF